MEVEPRLSDLDRDFQGLTVAHKQPGKMSEAHHQVSFSTD